MIDTLYILSAGHSGSTILNLILGSHSKTVAVSELTQLPKNVAHDEPCTCGQAVRSCPIWSEVLCRIDVALDTNALADPYSLELGHIGERRAMYRPKLNARYHALWQARRIGIYLSRRYGLPLPSFARQRFDLALKNREAVYEAIRKTTGAATIVDASKEYLTGIEYYRLHPERTRLILLVRNGRAVFYSNLKRGFGQPYSIKAWRNYYQHVLPILERCVAPSHVLTVHYEDLATRPEVEIERICKFVGLSFEPAMLDITSKEHHITSGNNMRFSADTRIRLDTAWQSQLKEADAAFFEKCAGTLNRKLGYE